MPFRYSIAVALALFVAPGAALAGNVPASTDDARMFSAPPKSDPAAAQTRRDSAGTDDARGVARPGTRSGSSTAPRVVEGTDSARGISGAPLGMMRPRG